MGSGDINSIINQRKSSPPDKEVVPTQNGFRQNQSPNGVRVANSGSFLGRLNSH